ncbi:hypothetical protein O2N63_01285 [Aliiroseovarius sp. KMU-50]|uniref:DUF6782 domain-containing protein n=1 Tax=Aliiroseovarius salicola TaxID=3009082 RepID=A0ABT4VYR6_9RHOB|nr:DUF6782 family putative metallopeptidase [Aliiroseovarius sp. KMU-50]MDA5092717.1 hypothetical protein [Aliiroseovarius sp. KMU-50]
MPRSALDKSFFTGQPVGMRLLMALAFVFVLPPSLAHASDTCINAPFLMVESDEQKELQSLVDGLSPARKQFPYLDKALSTNRLSLCFSSKMNNALGYLDAEEFQIVIDRSLSTEFQLGILLHELRHLWQLSTGACPSDNLSMKEYARAVFALEADASAISLLLAWEMREPDNNGIWDALSSWPSQSDIATRFAETMHQTGDESLAVTAAFYQWYGSTERRETYYAEACSGYLDRQDATHLIPRYQLIDAGFYKSLCRLPDGSSYRCSDPDRAPAQQ